MDTLLQQINVVRYGFFFLLVSILVLMDTLLQLFGNLINKCEKCVVSILVLMDTLLQLYLKEVIHLEQTVSILVLMDTLLQPVFSIKSFIYQYYRDFFRY